MICTMLASESNTVILLLWFIGHDQCVIGDHEVQIVLILGSWHEHQCDDPSLNESR